MRTERKSRRPTLPSTSSARDGKVRTGISHARDADEYFFSVLLPHEAREIRQAAKHGDATDRRSPLLGIIVDDANRKNGGPGIQNKFLEYLSAPISGSYNQGALPSASPNCALRAV